MSDETGSLMGRPGADGRFGEFGGRFVPESLMPACLELEKWFDDAWADPAFRAELDGLLRHYGGRPTPVTECTRLSERLGVRVLLKREDLAHTGSHKLNNVVGQALLTKRMGKARMIAETGAGQHGVAPPRRRRSSASNAPSSWARWTRSARSSTSSVWSCWARRCGR